MSGVSGLRVPLKTVRTQFDSEGTHCTKHAPLVLVVTFFTRNEESLVRFQQGAWYNSSMDDIMERYTAMAKRCKKVIEKRFPDIDTPSGIALTDTLFELAHKLAEFPYPDGVTEMWQLDTVENELDEVLMEFAVMDLSRLKEKPPWRKQKEDGPVV